jgi:glutaredoxin 3
MPKGDSPKRDWIDVVDGVLDRADRALDHLRKVPRRRLDHVPDPKNPGNPFEAPAPAKAPPKVKELGDPGLLVQIYGKRSCDKSGRAVKLIQDKSLPARLIDVDDPDNLGLENRLIQATKRYATPWVYVRGAFLGGFEDLLTLEKAGELDALLAAPGERA